MSLEFLKKGKPVLLWNYILLCILYSQILENTLQTANPAQEKVKNAKICGHDYLLLNKPDRLKRRLQQVDVQSVPESSSSSITQVKSNRAYRFQPDFTYMNQYLTQNPQLATLGEFSRRIIQRIQRYLGTYLVVNSFNTLSVGSFSCSYLYSGFSAPADFVAYVFGTYEPEATYYAAAAPCLIETSTKRPVVGEFFLNFAYISTGLRREYTDFFTYLHETFHLLGFADWAYTNYVNPAGVAYTQSDVVGSVTYGSQTYTTLKFANLVAFARSYYNCPDIQGIALENGGGSGSAGSHWDKQFLPDEFMNPTIDNDPKISDFSIELLKATGWYTVLDGMAQNFYHGKGAGCNFFTQCLDGDYVGACSSSDIGFPKCSTDYSQKANCVSNQMFAGGCGLLLNNEVSCELAFDNESQSRNSATEEFKPTSRCFSWFSTANPSQKSLRCNQAVCRSGNIVDVTVPGVGTFSCGPGSPVLTIDATLRLQCPNTEDFCAKLANSCPSYCLSQGAGMCLKNGKCHCFKGFDTTSQTCVPDLATIQVVNPGSGSTVTNPTSGTGGSSGGSTSGGSSSGGTTSGGNTSSNSTKKGNSTGTSSSSHCLWMPTATAVAVLLSVI